jgi:diaminopimelate epimerase
LLCHDPIGAITQAKFELTTVYDMLPMRWRPDGFLGLPHPQAITCILATFGQHPSREPGHAGGCARDGKLLGGLISSDFDGTHLPMTLRFTKMQGAGNDFVVLDATRAPLNLSPQQLMRLGDRRLGVGADQILVVEPSPHVGADFGYRIFNGADGQEVEHCGNGARCFVRYVLDSGLSTQTRLKVQTMNRLLVLQAQADGRVTVDMNEPVFNPAELPFDVSRLQPKMQGQCELWPLPINDQVVDVAVVSMGNPHAVHVVENTDLTPVHLLGPAIERHARFARGVNAGFMQIISRTHIRLRVFERSAGETLSCGTGACAAVVAGIEQGFLNSQVEVDTFGGRLSIAWQGRGHAVFMTGPAVTVFQGDIEL